MGKRNSTDEEMKIMRGVQQRLGSMKSMAAQNEADMNSLYSLQMSMGDVKAASHSFAMRADMQVATGCINKAHATGTLGVVKTYRNAQEIMTPITRGGGGDR